MRVDCHMHPFPALPLSCRYYSTALTVSNMHSLWRHWCGTKVMSAWIYLPCWHMVRSLWSTPLHRFYCIITHSRMLVWLICTCSEDLILLPTGNSLTHKIDRDYCQKCWKNSQIKKFKPKGTNNYFIKLTVSSSCCVFDIAFFTC